MNEIISTKREYYIQAQLNNGQWVRIAPYDNASLPKVQEIKDRQLSPPCRIVEVETIERVVYE